MNLFGSQELETNDTCAVCGDPCVSHVITGDRRRVACYACYENGSYDKYLKKHPELSESKRKTPTPQATE